MSTKCRESFTMKRIEKKRRAKRMRLARSIALGLTGLWAVSGGFASASDAVNEKPSEFTIKAGDDFSTETVYGNGKKFDDEGTTKYNHKENPGYSDTTVSGCTVIVEGGKFKSVYGGYNPNDPDDESKTGTASGNAVEITGGTLYGNGYNPNYTYIYGGAAYTANSNTVTVSGITQAVGDNSTYSDTNGYGIDIIGGGSLWGGGHVLSGYDDASATGNTVTVDGVNVARIRGGAATQTIGNHVFISNSRISNDVYGGMSTANEGGLSRENTVAVNSGTHNAAYSRDIDYIVGGSGNTSTENEVTVASAYDGVIGSILGGTGVVATKNNVVVNGGTIRGSVYGAEESSGTSSAQNIDLSDNSVEIKGGNANGVSIYGAATRGGVDPGQSATLSGNKVIVSGGTFTNGVNIYGGDLQGTVESDSAGATVSNNTITISGGTFEGTSNLTDIYGGRVSGGTATAITDNVINLNASNIALGYIYGYEGNAENISGNTLNVNGYGIKADALYNLNNLNFNITDAFAGKIKGASGTPMLTVTYTAALAGTEVKATVSGDSTIKNGDVYQLLSANSITGTPTLSGTITQGVSVDYNLEVEKNGNTLIATVTDGSATVDGGKAVNYIYNGKTSDSAPPASAIGDRSGYKAIVNADGTVNTAVYGGYVYGGSGAATKNAVEITGATLPAGKVAGGYLDHNGDEATGNINENAVTISGATFSKDVTIYGGRSIKGAADGNTITISNTKLEGNTLIRGGSTGNTNADGNTVKLSKSTAAFLGVIGGDGNKKASNNTVEIDGGTLANTFTITGGTGLTVTGNKVIVKSGTALTGAAIGDNTAGGYITGGAASDALENQTVTGNSVELYASLCENFSGRGVSGVKGGSAANAADAVVSGNTVTIEGTSAAPINVFGPIFGGSVTKYSEREEWEAAEGRTRKAESNRVSIKHAVIDSRVSGADIQGYIHDTISVTENEVSLEDVKFAIVNSNNVYGGSIYADRSETTAPKTATGNKVTLKDVDFGQGGSGPYSNDVYGGYVSSSENGDNVASASEGNITVSNNSVEAGGTIEGFFEITGGYASDTVYGNGKYAIAKENTVTVTDATVKGTNANYRSKISGGRGRTVSGNEVIVKGSELDRILINGGEDQGGLGEAVTGNKVTVTGSTITGAGASIRGGYTGQATASKNIVTIGTTTTTADIMGGATSSSTGSDNNHASATGNEVYITGGVIAPVSIAGGIVTSNSDGDATGNLVKISGAGNEISKVEYLGNIYGGLTWGNGSASGNTVTILSGTYKSDGTENFAIYGGKAERSGDAKDNTVNLGGYLENSAVKDAVASLPGLSGVDIYGGHAGGTSSGNTLNVFTVTTADNIADFQAINFYVPSTFKAGTDTMLNLTSTDGTDISGAKVSAGVVGSATIKKGDVLNLLTSAGTLTANGTTYGTLTVGVSQDFGLTVTKDGNKVIATVTASPNADTPTPEPEPEPEPEPTNPHSNNTVTADTDVTSEGGYIYGNEPSKHDANVTTLTDDAQNNTVNLTDGAKAIGIYGSAAYGDADLTKDSVNMSGGEAGSVTGAATVSGSTNTSAVNITGGTVTEEVVGGRSNSGTVTNAAVEIAGGAQVSSRVTGGYTESGTVTGGSVAVKSAANVTSDIYGSRAEGNGKLDGGTVEVTGGTVTGAVYGARAEGSGAVTGATVKIAEGAVVNGDVTGGYAESGTVTGTNVTIAGDAKITGNVTGDATDGSGTLSGATVAMSGGSVTGNVYGSYAKNGDAVKNTLTFTGGTVNGDIYGGSSDSGKTTNNTVNLGDDKGTYKATLTNSTIYGGSNASDVKGNTLNVNAAGITVKNIENFEKAQFDVAQGSSDKAMLTIHDENGVDLSGTKIMPKTDTQPETGAQGVTAALIGAKTIDGVTDTNTWQTAGDYEYSLALNDNGDRLDARIFQYQNHEVAVSAATEGDVFGGLAQAGSHAAQNNKLTIGAKVTGDAYGGKAQDAAGGATQNTLSVGADVTGGVFGGYAEKGDAGTADAPNTLDITGGTIAGNAYGGFAADGKAAFNVAKLGKGATVEGSLYGGHSESGAAEKNTVELNGGKVMGDVIGGGCDTATGNVVNVNDGEVLGTVYGAKADTSATGNIVNIYGGTMADVFAATAKTSSSNTLNIGGPSNTSVNAAINGSLYGRADTDAGDGNTLNVYAKGATAKNIYNFDNIHFYLPSDYSTGDTMLALTDTAGTDISGAQVKAGVAGDANINVDDEITLLTTAGTLTDTGTAYGELTQGVSQGYAMTLAKGADGKSVVATVTKAAKGALRPQTQILTETRAASASMLNNDADFLAMQGIGSAVEAAKAAMDDEEEKARGFTPFVAFGGSKMRAESGSHVDVRGWGADIGFARAIRSGGGILSFGPFIEYGKGSYTSVINDGTNGWGDMHHTGVGFFVRQDSASGFWYEGSVRAGRLSSDYRGNVGDIATSYDADNNYYGLHLGVGKLIPSGEKGSFDVYGRFFYTHQSDAHTTLATGDRYEFGSVDSSRLRVGARYTSGLGTANRFYAGLAYEYEFSGKARGSYYNNGAHVGDTPSPSLKGGSAMMELGWQMKPEGSPMTLDLGLTGWAGKRRGLGGHVSMSWSF